MDSRERSLVFLRRCETSYVKTVNELTPVVTMTSAHSWFNPCGLQMLVLISKTEPNAHSEQLKPDQNSASTVGSASFFRTHHKHPRVFSGVGLGSWIRSLSIIFLAGDSWQLLLCSGRGWRRSEMRSRRCRRVVRKKKRSRPGFRTGAVPHAGQKIDC